MRRIPLTGDCQDGDDHTPIDDWIDNLADEPDIVDEDRCGVIYLGYRDHTDMDRYLVPIRDENQNTLGYWLVDDDEFTEMIVDEATTCHH